MCPIADGFENGGFVLEVRVESTTGMKRIEGPTQGGCRQVTGVSEPVGMISFVGFPRVTHKDGMKYTARCSASSSQIQASKLLQNNDEGVREEV